MCILQYGTAGFLILWNFPGQNFLGYCVTKKKEITLCVLTLMTQLELQQVVSGVKCCCRLVLYTFFTMDVTKTIINLSEGATAQQVMPVNKFLCCL